jgi:hypothetical protein
VVASRVNVKLCIGFSIGGVLLVKLVVFLIGTPAKICRLGDALLDKTGLSLFVVNLL